MCGTNLGDICSAWPWTKQCPCVCECSQVGNTVELVLRSVIFLNVWAGRDAWIRHEKSSKPSVVKFLGNLKFPQIDSFKFLQ